MITADMQRKMKIARKKVWDAIEQHGGTTLLSTGITGDDARMAKASVDAGARQAFRAESSGGGACSRTSWGQ